MPESLFDFVRAYQDSHDCTDDDMLHILCDAVENGLDHQLGSIEAADLAIGAIKDQLKD